MYTRIIIVLFFLHISLLFASAPASQHLQRISAFTKIENQGSAINRLEAEVARLSSENIELKNNIAFLNNVVFSIIKAQNDLLVLVKNDFDQHGNERTNSAAQGVTVQTSNAHSSITNPTTKRQPLIRRSSFTSTNTNPQ